MRKQLLLCLLAISLVTATFAQGSMEHGDAIVNVSPKKMTKAEKMSLGDTVINDIPEDTPDVGTIVIPDLNLPGTTIPSEITLTWLFGDFKLWLEALLMSLLGFLLNFIPGLEKYRNRIKWIVAAVIVGVMAFTIGIPEWKSLLAFLLSGGGYTILGLFTKSMTRQAEA